MRYYPIFANLDGRHCLVVGAGGVGMRKTRSLVDSGASRVTVIDTCEPDADGLFELPQVEFHCREFRETDLDGVFLAIACTSNNEVNERIGELCATRNMLCNIADQPDMGSFIVPATVNRGDLTVAISTSGQSPAMAKRIRQELQESFGDEYGQVLALMGRIRPLMLALELETKENTAVFRALVNSGLLEALKCRDLDSTTEILKELLPHPLHDNIPELLDGLV